jgi:hypothetical protein
MPSSPDLGPLPRADGGAELQRESFRQFFAALPAGDWIARDERTDDFGVDVALEVVADGAATNFRSHVQLKGRTGVAANADGSYSVPVQTSNLNYLLNGLTPLYVLYRPEARDFWYAFARDEHQRIERNNSGWKSQGEITIRFALRLDNTALELVRERIVREQRAMRQLHDLANSLAPGTRLSVDTTTLESTSPLEVERFLLSYGMSAISVGLGNKVLSMCSVFGDGPFAANPKLALVRGYAEFSRSHYLRAEPWLREALLGNERLAADERHFLQFLVEAVDAALGRVSAAEFRERTTEWRRAAPPEMAAQYDLLDCWLSRASSVTEEEVRKSDAALRIAIGRARAFGEKSPSLARQAELLLLFCDAQETAIALSDAIVASQNPRLWSLRFQEPPKTIIGREIDKFNGLRQRLTALMRELHDSLNVPLLCQALHTCDLCDEMFLGYLTMAAQLTENPPPSVPDALVERSRATAEFARANDQIEVWLRAGLVEADLEDLRGNVERCKVVTRGVMDRARTLRFADIERIARQALEEGGMHSVRKREIQTRCTNNLDSFFLSLTPDNIDQIIRDTLQLPYLVDANLRVIRDSLECEIDGAKERHSWCQHLHILERGTDDNANRYSRAPERCCRCERFGTQSLITGSDWRALIAAFKRTRCDECPVRDPKEKKS